MRKILFAAALLFATTGAFWGSETGIAIIRLRSAIPPNKPLYVGSEAISGYGERSLQLGAGSVSITDAAGWQSYWAKTYCDLKIQKDRSTTVTVSMVNGQPSCTCAAKASQSTPDKPVCR